MNINDARLTDKEIANASTTTWPQPPNLDAVLDAQLRKALWWIVAELAKRQSTIPYPGSVKVMIYLTNPPSYDTIMA